MPDEYRVVSQDGRLVAEFDWHGDRYCHRLSYDGNSVGKSIEGDAEAIWPPSPPIQQLSLERIDQQSMVLGVGAAGRSHWSLSAQPCKDDATALQFDFACRSKDSAVFLGSSYQLETPLHLSIIHGRFELESDVRRILADGSKGPTRQWSYRLSVGP